MEAPPQARKTETRKKGGGATPFGALLLVHLETTLRSLIAQAEHLSEPAVLRAMGAGDLAVLFGTMFDRTMRALELAPAFFGRQEAGRQGRGPA